MDSDAIRKLLDEATPGPWKLCQTSIHGVAYGGCWVEGPDEDPGDGRIRGVLIPITGSQGAMSYTTRLVDRQGHDDNDANARLIAAAPDLAAEVLRLRLLLGQANSLLGQWGSFGCPDCGGDCASANPPVIGCLPQATASLLNDIRAAMKEADNA